MPRALLRLFTIGLLPLLLAGSAPAEEVKGTITKVEDQGREIVIKDKGGKEVNVKISGSRTKVDGVKSRSDLKEGQNVTVEYEKGEAKTIRVAK